MSSDVVSQSAPRHTLHLRIINLSNEQVKIELHLPINLVSTAQRLGAHLLPAGASLETILAQAAQERVAHLAWTDAAQGERLELTLN